MAGSDTEASGRQVMVVVGEPPPEFKIGHSGNSETRHVVTMEVGGQPGAVDA